MKYFNVHTFFFTVLIFSLLFLVFRGVFDVLLSSVLAREPFATLQYHRIPRTSETEPPLPYGYVIDSSSNYVSRFPLEEIPANGVPGNYAEVTTISGKMMIPNTESAIYAAIEKFNSTAIDGNISYQVPIIVHRDDTDTTLENIDSIMRQTELAFFNNTNRGTLQANLQITWKTTLKNIDNFTGTTETQFFDFIKQADGLDINGTTPHLFFLTKNTSTLPAVFSNVRDTPIIVCTHPVIDQSGLPGDKLRLLTHHLCRALGLKEFEAANASEPNIMNTLSISGYETNQSQNVTLRQKASSILAASTKTDTETDTLASKITGSLAEEALKRQNQYKNSYYDNIQYHDSEASIRAASSSPGEGTGIAYVIDKNGNKIGLGKSSTQPNQLFYTPGSFPFGSASYVPKYDDAVYLSKLTGETTASMLEGTAAMKGGFCTQEAHNKLAIDEKCRATDKNQCASLTCCVLLGGAKCVAGNEQGPTMTGHYSDFTIRDRDYYYYQGKCYGHCPESNPL
uniref:Uncharacterized protein n=1 Tax=viral metagenome TaxID=1070528 RepID=A0A6C0HJJ3_9ZZZZ